MAISKGYHEVSATELANLPSKIKCIRCKTVKNFASFAKHRLRDLSLEIQNKPRYNATAQGFIACNQCTSTQVHELYCTGCDKVKGKSSFSKAQCRTPDKAKCWSCMEEQLNIEPGRDSDSDGGSGASDDSDSDDSEYGRGATVAGTAATFSTLSMTHGSSATGGVALGSPLGSPAHKNSISSGPGNSHGGVKMEPSTTSSTVTDSKTDRPSGFNTKGYGTPPHLRARTAGSVTSEASSKFAKVKAGPRKITMQAADEERGKGAKDLEAELDDVEVSESDSD